MRWCTIDDFVAMASQNGMVILCSCENNRTMASAKRSDDQWDQLVASKKHNRLAQDPTAALADSRINMSIKASASFYIYSRHFNPTVLILSRLMAGLEGTEAIDAAAYTPTAPPPGCPPSPLSSSRSSAPVTTS